MKLAMAQMRMSVSGKENLEKSVSFLEEAARGGAQLIVFPELQLSPFFPQYEKRDAGAWLVTLEGPEIRALREACRRAGIWACPNVYLKEHGRAYDASLMIRADGELLGVSKMVHIAQSRYFYERDYYTPSEDGFRVWETPFGTIGVVICFDRHIPDGIRSCAKQGADLVLIPTANILEEPLELFAWEVRVQAFQSTAFVAMCNRVGREDRMEFAGQSLLAGPEGDLRFQADGEERLLLLDVPLEEAARQRSARPWLMF